MHDYWCCESENDFWFLLHFCFILFAFERFCIIFLLICICHIIMSHSCEVQPEIVPYVISAPAVTCLAHSGHLFRTTSLPSARGRYRAAEVQTTLPFSGTVEERTECRHRQWRLSSAHHHRMTLKPLDTGVSNFKRVFNTIRVQAADRSLTNNTEG